MAQHNELGKKGEDLAVEFLIKNGFEILDRNWRFKKAEIDIIAQKDDLLVMAEVKTRSTDFFGDPQEFIKPKQKN
ncbi:MAG: YraN family protein, partial [Bacteroidota bacterium]